MAAAPLRTKKLPSQARENRQSIGVSSISQQMMQQLRQKGFDFCLMLAGESGLGKSTLIGTLFGADKVLSRGQVNKTASERIPKTVDITELKFTVEEKGVTARMTVLDTPGFADSVDTRGCWEPIVQYIDGTFMNFLKYEMQADRSQIVDSRVHALLYFINPSSHGLKPLDIEALRALHHKVNIIPVIAKADTLTKPELKKLKDAIRTELEKYEIDIFVPDTSDESSLLFEESVELETLMPFAVVGASKITEVGGRQIRSRVYPWGAVEVDNSEHCDFTPLRKMLIITHTQELKLSTEKTLYENWRRDKLKNDPSVQDRIRLEDDQASKEKARQLEEANRLLEQKQLQMQRDFEERQQTLERQRQEVEEMKRMLALAQAQMQAQAQAQAQVQPPPSASKDHPPSSAV